MPYNRYRRHRRRVMNKQLQVANYVRPYAKGAAKIGLVALKHKLGLNTEQKYYDTEQASMSITTTPTTQVGIVQVPPGTNWSQRVGSKIKATSFYLKLRLNHNPAGANTQTVRILLVRQLTAGAVPADVIDPNVSYLVGPRNMSYTDRYKVLMDKLIHVSPGQLETYYMDKYFKLDNRINYIEGTNVAERNGMFLIFVSDQPTNSPTLMYHARLRYVDN